MKNPSATDLSLNFHSHTTIPTSINGMSYYLPHHFLGKYRNILNFYPIHSTKS